MFIWDFKLIARYSLMSLDPPVNKWGQDSGYFRLKQAANRVFFFFFFGRGGGVVLFYGPLKF